MFKPVLNLYLIAAESPVQCGRPEITTDEEYNNSCFLYSHTYNNMITGGSAFDNGANFLYSDMSVGRNTYERNILFGTEEGGALKNNCGKLNMGINNIVHRTGSMEYAYGGCRKGDRENPMSLENFHNIYLFDNMDGFSFARPIDRYFDETPDFHDNLYWSLVDGDKEQEKFPDNRNWDDWQSTGNDTGSLWQDPLFEDPSAGRYILAANSPAWDLGIEQIDLDNIGIQVQGKYHGN